VRPEGDVVAEVGELYLNARSAQGDPVLRTAYEHLQAETDRLFGAIIGGHDPVRIVFTRCLAPYASDRELIAATRISRVLEVTTAATSRERIHPVLGCHLGGPFDRLRAVHDLVGHVRTGFGFGLDDELAAWRVQDRLHGPLARRALATELLAVNSARSIIGETPGQKAVLLSPGLLDRARTPSVG
jgi:hypothetical protein